MDNGRQQQQQQPRLQQQQQYTHQYDAPRIERSSQQEWRQYDGRESPVNTRRHQQQQHSREQYQQQHPRQQRRDSRYDDAHNDNYSKEETEMREVSHYPPAQLYNNPAVHGHYSGGGVRSQPQNSAGLGNGPAYAPAPVATASMADLRDSITNSTTSDGRPAKKPKRVYETAFGPFSWSDLVKRKFWKYYAMLIVIGIAVLLAVIFHDDIIKWMQPVAEKIRDIPGGWAIFVGIMFVISFPPLFGQEVLGLLCGLIYGLWWGFAIISLGTILGEWGNFLVFKYWCSARSAKTEEKDVTYACMCRVIREGGFKIAFMARLSAIPGHLTTPAFAACGMSFWIFTITAIVTLPKQLLCVYLGTVFGKPDTNEGITTAKIVEWVVLGGSFIITIVAAWYIYAKMAKWRPIVMQEQAENRMKAQEVLERDSVMENGGDPEQFNKAGMPRITLSDETGIVKSPSGRSQRFSLNRWSDREHNAGELSRQYGGSNVRRMEEGSLGDLDGAKSPLVADSEAPAGHTSYNQYDEKGLYPLASTISPYNSSEEDVGYGYADGGEVRNQPYRQEPRVPGSSADVSMRWNPPQLDEDSLSDVQQNYGQRPVDQPAQYNPTQYRQQYRSPTRNTAADSHTQDQASNMYPSQPPSTLPNSFHQSEVMNDRQYQSKSDSSDRQVPLSASVSPAQQSMQHTSRDPRTADLPEGARLYPSNHDLMPQPSNARPSAEHPHHGQQAASRYPDMIEPRQVEPLSSTNYHTGPLEHSSTRYRSEPDPSRSSPYHTGPLGPDAAYRSEDQYGGRRQ